MTEEETKIALTKAALKTLVDTADHLQGVTEHLQKLRYRTEAGYALIGTTIINNTLQSALQAKMVKLTKSMKARLFEGYGPLSTFSARIDVSYAIGLISEETHKHLLAAKRIRNTFAHTDDPLDFRSPTILEACSALPDYKPGSVDLLFYINALKKIDDEINAGNNPASGQPSSPEKSSQNLSLIPLQMMKPHEWGDTRLAAGDQGSRWQAAALSSS